MKVNQPSKNPISLEQLILQLQLTLELSQIQEILSTYSVLLLFLAKYSFLFENSSLETPSLKNTHTNFKTPFFSPDPARDGWNWWGYCAGNPVMNVDANGCIQHPIFSKTVMQNAPLSMTLNGTSILVYKEGCAVAAIANMLSQSLDIINSKYVENGNMNWDKVAKDYGWKVESVNDKQFTKQMYDSNSENTETDFYTIVNVNYTVDGTNGNHWVGLESVVTIDNIDYVVIAASSDNDYSITTGSVADRKGRGWKIDEHGNILVPVSQTKGYRTFYKGNVDNYIDKKNYQSQIPKSTPQKDPDPDGKKYSNDE